MHLYPDLYSRDMGTCRKTSSPHRQGIIATVAGLASRLVELLRSVCAFLFGTEEDARSLLSFFARYSQLPVLLTSSAYVSRFPEARE